MTERHQFQDAFDEAQQKFLITNPRRMAELAEVTWDEPFLKLKYLNFGITVNHHTGEFSGERVFFEEQIIIYQYLTESCGVSGPGSNWLSFLELPGGQHHYVPFIKEALEPLARYFGSNPALFLKSGTMLGGKTGSMKDVSFELRVLPKIALFFILRVGDEEFSATSNILFDGRSSYHLPTATLYMMGINAVKRLVKKGKTL